MASDDAGASERGMDAARWQRLESLCYAALERKGASRAAFLDDACRDDAGLRQDVESLIEQHEREPSFLEHPLVDLAPLAPNDVPEPASGTIGPYRLVRRLGRGGMGEVYLAVREVEDIQQDVALKIIRRGMDTEEVLRRFRLERRILANLHHPHIARLLDAAATDDGRPYFVMEYIEGVSLTDFCDQHRLPIRKRLELFQQICRAVQHAHQNLVVHRDLKPKNILVTDDGVPKLLDFGIGKVLAATDAFGSAVETASEVRLLTPEYAAPEQVTGGLITTATDVYALGVMLYELLSGHHPYASGQASRQDIERAILEANPDRPSVMVSRVESRRGADGSDDQITPHEVGHRRATDPGHLQRRLSGDLDNIVLMALRKEPTRRYPSAAALADDLQRHLDGLPVSARADTLGYRLGKFVRRNAAAVAAAAIAFLALGVVTAVTLVQSSRVTRESERVTRERDKALEVRGFLMEMFGATGADQAIGDTVSVRRLLDLQAAQLPKAYAGRPELKAEMMEVLADGYDRLGLYRDAEPLAREALALRRGLLGAEHPDVATSLNLHGWVVHELGRPREAEPILKEAAAIRRGAGPAHRGDLARSLNDLGVVYNELTRYAEAESVLTEALAIRRAAHGDDHRVVGITANNLAASYYYRTKLDDAVRMQALAVSSLQGSVGLDHQRTIVALGNLAAFKRAKGDLGAAEADYRELLVRQTRLQGRDHPVTARMMMSLATVLGERGARERSDTSFGEAEALLREALAVYEVRLGPTHSQVGQTIDRLNMMLIDRGRPRDALPLQLRAVSVLRAALGDSNSSTLGALARLAQIRWRLNEQSEAIRVQRQTVALTERARGPTHLETARAHTMLCDYLLSSRGDAAEAARHCAAAERAYREAPQTFRRAVLIARLRLVQASMALGAQRVADSVLALVKDSASAADPKSVERRLYDSLTTRRR